MQRAVIIILMIIFFSNNIFGQENKLPCATHIMTKKEFEKNPKIFLKNKEKLDSITHIFNTNSRGFSEKIIAPLSSLKRGVTIEIRIF